MKKNKTNLILLLISIPAISAGLFEVANYYLGADNVWFFCVFVALVIGSVIIPMYQVREFQRKNARNKRHSW